MVQLAQEDAVFLSKMMPLLNEKQRRILLGSYSEKLGRGSTTALSQATGYTRETIIRGRTESQEITPDIKARSGAETTTRVRAAGAGRKPITEKYPSIKDELSGLLEGNVIGNPENPLCWTTKSLRNLSEQLKKKGFNVNHVTVGQLLESMGFSLQQNRKYVESGNPGPDRDEQFSFINNTSKRFLEIGNPVISVDTKKKELVGNFQNKGKEYCPKGEPALVNDHDFPDPHTGKAAPYGIYDVGRNEGFVNIGLSADTGAFAVNSIRSWWQTMGKDRYPQANKLYITADGGGSNGRRNKLWKVSLQEFANETGLTIHVSHFPPGTSKWNKIEHRLFSQISKNWRGRPLETIEIIVSLIASTTTKTGLTVQCQVDKTEYEKGIVVSDEQLENLNLKRNAWHGEWNYEIAPNLR